MLRRGAVLSLVVFVCSAVTAHAEGVVIDHKAVGCIVVGKYPKMNACFTPAADLARSRVYFRPEGASGWYYVEMKADESCFAGTLPKPGKKLVGKKIEYYVEAQNKAFEPARTAEFGPVVVKSAQECKKDVPVAPFLNNATVAVFPALPAGFVGGGIGTAAIVGIAAAGAAAAGTAVAVIQQQQRRDDHDRRRRRRQYDDHDPGAHDHDHHDPAQGQQGAVRGPHDQPRSAFGTGTADRDLRPVQEHRSRWRPPQLLLQLRRWVEGLWVLP